LGIIVGPTLGPPLGGYIVDNFSWPYIFYINIPIGIIAAALTFQFVRSPKYGKKKSVSEVDWLGILFLALSVGSLQYVLERGQEDYWFENSTILSLSILAFVSGYFFIWRELTCKNPIVKLRVLLNGNLRIGTILTFILGFGLYGSTFIIPLYLQTNLGFSAQQAGMTMVPSSIATAFMMPIIGFILQKGFKHKYLAASGMFFFFIYSVWAYKILTPDTGEMDFFWLLMLRGFALSMLFIPITTLALSTLDGQEIGEGASFTGMMRQLGGSFGIALITTFMSWKSASHIENLATNITSDNFLFQQKLQGLTARFMSSGMAPNQAKEAAMRAINASVMSQASVLTYMDVFLYIGLMFLICVPFILLIKDSNKKVDMSAAMH